MGETEERFYRSRPRSPNWVSFTVAVKESDLWIRAHRDLSREGYGSLFQRRYAVEEYIRQHPEFQDALAPLPLDPWAPPLI